MEQNRVVRRCCASFSVLAASVAIIGAGMGGLTLAAALHQRSIPVRIYEQAPQFVRLGAGIQMSPNAMRVLRGIGRFDCVVVGGPGDSGPWPIFDALYAGAGVIAPPSGWAASLLADGTCGRLVSNAPAMSAALEEILAAAAAWRSRRAQIRARVAELSLSAWMQANLRLAADLARAPVQQAA